MAWINFYHMWAKYFYKENACLVDSGKTAIIYALKHLNSHKVALPTYTCERVLQACLTAGVQPYIIDCKTDLQINLKLIPKEVDTVIIPHMFGIQSNIPKNRHYKVIEDCSQCIGLENLGKHSDVVVASTGPTKWLNASDNKLKSGGLICYNGKLPCKIDSSLWCIGMSLNSLFSKIPQRLENRQNRVNELINAGLDLIGKDQPNAWLRAMYFGTQKRVPYTPLHDIYPGFECPVVDSYKNKLDWISIFH